MLTPREGVYRLLAPNPTPMTLAGTNTYVVDCGKGYAAVIDPGPRTRGHVVRVRETLDAHGLELKGIFVTHGHLDHAPGAGPLARPNGAPVYGHPAGTFGATESLADGKTVAIGNRRFRCIHAPGHSPDSIAILEETTGALFTGDTIIGAPSTLIAPQTGSMRAYQQTLERLAALSRGVGVIFGGHGEPMTDAPGTITAYIAHRRRREAEILAAFDGGPRTVPELVKLLYPKLPPEMRPAASRQLLAHIAPLVAEGRLHGRSVGRKMTLGERKIFAPELGERGYPEEGVLDPALLGKIELPFDIKVYSSSRHVATPARTPLRFS